MPFGYNIQPPSSKGVIENGLILNLDSSYTSSYPRSGTTWTDIKGNRAFTLFNTPNFTSSFQGSFNFVNATISPATPKYASYLLPSTPLTRFTLNVWANFTTFPAAGSNTYISVFTEIYNATGINYAIGEMNDDGRVTGGFFTGGVWRTPTGFAPTLNTWYNLCVSYDGSTVKFYSNGVLNSSLSFVGTPTSSGLGYYVARRWDTANYMNGFVPVVNLYNRVLTDNEIAYNYQALKGRYGL